MEAERGGGRVVANYKITGELNGNLQNIKYIHYLIYLPVALTALYTPKGNR